MTTKSIMHCEQLIRPLHLSRNGKFPNVPVQSSDQVHYANFKTCFKQDESQVSRKQNKPAVVTREVKQISLNNKSVMEKTTEWKNNKVKKSKSHSHSQGLLENISLPTLKHKRSLSVEKSSSTAAGDAVMLDVNKDETADIKQLKQKKSNKKRQDGVSNWMKLCATLDIDGTKRKTRPVKRPASSDAPEQGEHSQAKRTKPGIWFDNVDRILIESETCEQSGVDVGGNSAKGTTDPLVKPDSFKGVTNCVAMDCEMVGVGPKGEESILARVSIVNHFGVCLYDKYVLPQERVTDYRTYVSGVTAEHLATGEEFTKVQSEVSDFIRDRILVGHAVHNDLKVLLLTHPHKMIRDTSLYKPFRELFSGRLPSLKKLTDRVLGVRVQEGQHSSVQDAQATMRLYTMYRQKWEKELRKERKTGRSKKKKKQQQQI